MATQTSDREQANLLRTAAPASTNSSNSRDISLHRIRLAAGGYMICSSIMLITNKLAVHHLPAPKFVLFSQLFTSAFTCFIFGSLYIADVDHLEWTKVKPYIPAAAAFLGTLFTNLKALQYCNVETFIIFRASTPIAVSIGDYLFLGRELPSARSLLCLLGLVGGVALYTATDAGFELDGYFWLMAWFFIFLIDQLYIKYVCKNIQMRSNWGRVYYLNSLSCVPLFFAFVIATFLDQELAKDDVQFTFVSITFLIISCVLAVAMSYFAFWCRHVVSATSFTILGNVCKVITVMINLLIWDKHANVTGLFALCICLICAYFYKQAPLRTRLRSTKSGTTTLSNNSANCSLDEAIMSKTNIE